MWSKLTDVPPRAFDGSPDDIAALDFIDYEAGHHPEGLAGAAVIWAGVLVATGALTWAIGDEQHWVLMADQVLPRALIFPYARIAELNQTIYPQYRKYQWLMDEAVMRLWMGGGFDDYTELKLLSQIDKHSQGYFDSAKHSIDEMRGRRNGSQ